MQWTGLLESEERMLVMVGLHDFAPGCSGDILLLGYVVEELHAGGYISKTSNLLT